MNSVSTTSIPRRRLVISLYIVVTLLYWVSLYLYIPTLPTYVQARAGNLALVGTILAQYGLWQAITRLPVGIMADWLGRRKPFIMAGIALAGLGAWLMGNANGADGLLVGRAVTGLAAATWVPLTVLFSSLFPAGEAVRATAILTLVGSLGRVLATSVTGALNQMAGYALAFFLATGVAGLGVLVLLATPEKPRPRKRPSVKGVGVLISRRDVLLPALLSAVSQYVTWAVPFGFLPILAEQLGATDVSQSMLVSLHIALVTLGSLVAATLSERWGARNLVQISLVLLSAGVAGAALAPSVPFVFAAQFGIGLGMGVSYPVLMGLSIRDVNDEQRTTAMGLHQAVYAAGMFAGPWLSGILAEAIGLRPTLWVTALGALAVGMFLIRLLPGKRQGRAPAPLHARSPGS